MDSGNSDSFQSSNGGDEDYNSRGGGDGDTISGFISPSATRVCYNPLPHQPMFGDPVISNYQILQNNIVLSNNLDTIWSKEPRSDPSCNESSNPLFSQQLFIIQNSNLPSTSPTPAVMNTNAGTSSLPLSDHHQTHGLASVRNPNPKKRSRASRRAPTTVLATDTTNFRAMVQEFTGIPEPPFTTSSHSPLFSRNGRLDNLFGTSSSMRSSPLDYSISLSSQPPPYIRPLSQKVQPPMFGASTVLDSVSTNADDNYQRIQSSNLFTMQNPILASLLQSNPPKTNLSDNPSILESKTHHGSMQSQSSSGVLDAFCGLGEGPVDNNGSLDALPGLVSAYPERVGAAGADQVRCFGNNSDDLSTNVASGKRPKGVTEDGARSEGMMGTWICSSSQ